MKHNNQLPNGHFKKDWKNRVRTWLNQPARKLRRREARLKKALKVAPRPVAGSFRPQVHCTTVRYNVRSRLGRGFTLEELKQAGITKNEARTIGIAVDHRRQNHSEESLKANTQRLKEYKSKLIVFPRKAGKPKAGDSTQAELSGAKQLKGSIVRLSKQSSRIRARKITDDEKAFKAVRTLQAARTHSRMEGVRAKAAKEKSAEAAE